MKKNNRLFAILLVALLATAMVFAGCGKKEEEPEPVKTLESVVAEDASIQEELNASFADSGLDGTVTFKENKMIMTVEIDELLGDMELDDDTKALLSDSFEGAFNESEAELCESIADVEAETGIKGVTMEVIVTYKGETVFQRTFEAK